MLSMCGSRSTAVASREVGTAAAGCVRHFVSVCRASGWWRCPLLLCEMTRCTSLQRRAASAAACSALPGGHSVADLTSAAGSQSLTVRQHCEHQSQLSVDSEQVELRLSHDSHHSTTRAHTSHPSLRRARLPLPLQALSPYCLRCPPKRLAQQLTAVRAVSGDDAEASAQPTS